MGRGSIVSISLSVSQAEENRDTVAKTLYSNMFDWTIVKVGVPPCLWVEWMGLIWMAGW